MIFLTVFYVLSILATIQSNTVTSPQIRILDVATKASETRLIPHRVEYQNSFHPYFHQQNRYGQNTGLPKSYVIYDEYPLKVFKEWKANPPTEFSSSEPQNYLEFSRQPNAEFLPVYYFQNGQQILPQPKPTLAYSSVYSNVIKVFEDSLNGLDRNRFQSEKYIKPYEENVWKSQPPTEYNPEFPQEIPRRELYHNFKLPDNFPKVFSPNDKFHFPSFDEGMRPPPKLFYPQGGYYGTHTINYNRENTGHHDEVEILPEVLKQKNQKKPFLCSFIRVNQRQFPENGGPCARSDDNFPLIPPEYPDYSSLPNDKIPVEHRRHHFQIKRIKRSELNESYESRQKRDAGIGFGYSGWGSPFNYESGYEGYFNDNNPSRGNFRDSSYYNNNNRNRNQNYRSRYYSGSRYDDYDDDYQNNDDSNSRGLSGYLTNGGRRYKNRKNNNDDEDDDYDDNNNNNNNSDNNRDDDSDEEMERMNSNRRDINDRRNNDDSRDRRRNNNNSNNNNNNNKNNNNNNNNNDDDDYRDNRRNNNRNNSRRNNNNRRNNDRYDNNSNSNNNNNGNNSNSNRNRYYSSSNGYSNNNGYGSGYGSYGSNYGGYGSGGYGSGGYGSGGYGSGGYGSGGYGGGGYGSGYGSNGGYGYGGYGNGFGSF